MFLPLNVWVVILLNQVELKMALSKHLVDVEESYQEFLEDLYPNPSKERYEISDLLRNYIIKLEELVGGELVTDEALPCVIIGSSVELSDLTTNQVLNYKIVTPFNGIKEFNNVSFLSPVGRKLLMKKPGEQISINVPAGVLNYSLLSVKPNYNEILAPFYSKH